MSRVRIVEMMVGFFIAAAIAALFFLAFKVSGVDEIGQGGYYSVSCGFDNVGDLKNGSPVTLAGVKIGTVESISLDVSTLQAKVLLRIIKKFNNIPVDSSASILTQGLLGSNYIGLTPGFDTSNLRDHSVINTTHSAIILENIIGQLVYSLKGGGQKSE